MFWSSKKSDAVSETDSLVSQLEHAKRRITELMLENIQLAHEVQTLRDYGAPAVLLPALMTGANVAQLPAAANSETGVPFRLVAN